MPDNTLKQPVPTPTAEELAARILDIGEGALVDLTKGKTLREALNIAEKSHLDALKKSADLIASALAQAKAEARREAADGFCEWCPGKCAYERKWDKCPDRAAILGHGEER